MDKTLTVFTPTYNRKHTIVRTFDSLCCQTNRDFCWLIIDDGSTDGTREWVESLGIKLSKEGPRFDWMGRVVDGYDKYHFILETDSRECGVKLLVEYILKPNGGLYSGYNTAYSTIQTELSVCIDSDDFMPEDAVEKIISIWRAHYPQGSQIDSKSKLTGKEYCGILGLDFDINTMTPIGGYFPKNMIEGNMLEIESRNLHKGDTKQAMRTDLMKKIAPMVGFKGEKNFNPFYMLMQVCDKYTMLIINDNLCTVEYQIGADSMSQGIFRQFLNSPNSFAKYRAKTMELEHTNWYRRLILGAHYVSSCIIAKDKNWLRNSPYKLLTLLMSPLGLLLYFYISKKAKQ